MKSRTWIKIVGVKGVYQYTENQDTGERDYQRKYIGHSALDLDWLKGGEWKDKKLEVEYYAGDFGPG